MSRGLALEESVLAMWAEQMGGVDWESVGKVVAESMPHAHATIDACARFGMGGWTVLDAKTASIYEMGEEWGPDGSDALPAEYHLQGLWYLGVCKAAGMTVVDEALFPTLCGPEVELQWAARLVTKTGKPLALADLEGTGLDLRVYHVAWDPVLFAEVDGRVREFLRQHVEPGIPPEPGPGDVPDRDIRAVSKSIRAETGRVLEFGAMPAAAQAQVLALLEATREQRAWDTVREQAAVRVKLLMGTAEEIRGLPDGARVTWRDTSGGGRRFEVRERRGGK